MNNEELLPSSEQLKYIKSISDWAEILEVQEHQLRRRLNHKYPYPPTNC